MTGEPWTDFANKIDNKTAKEVVDILFDEIDRRLVDIANSNKDDLEYLLINVEFSLANIRDSIMRISNKNNRLNNENENKDNT